MTQYESSDRSRGASDDALWVVLYSPSHHIDRVYAADETRRIYNITAAVAIYIYTVVVVIILPLSFLFIIDLWPTDLARNTICI